MKNELSPHGKKTGACLCPVAGPAGYLFPGGLVYFVNIVGKPEPLAAIHAAKAYGTSTKPQFYQSAALLAFQAGIFHHVDVLYPICTFFKTEQALNLPLR